MEEKVVEIFGTLSSAILRETAFWSAITGAIVGGFIAYIVQVKALRERRRQRAEDHERIQQALGNALLFKMIRIHSNFYGMHRHIEECFEEAARREFKGEPWQFLLPLANPPASVHFSSEEMSMLLALKNDDAFNLVVPMDAIHNSLNSTFKVLNTERRALTERLTVDDAEGTAVSGVLDKQQELALRPHMIEVNTLIENMRVHAEEGL